MATRPYRYICDTDRYHRLLLPQDLSLDWPNSFDGGLIADGWEPPPLSIYQCGALGNFPYLAGNLPVVDAEAWRLLGPLLEDHVEALPIPAPEPEWPDLFALNVTRIVDCLDEEASELSRFGELILGIGHYALDEERIADVPIFRIPGYHLTAVFVSPEFRRVVDDAGLKGLVWKPLP